MTVLDPRDADRFGKLLGLLGSDQVGERAAAALKGTEFLTARKLTWFDIGEMLKHPPVVVEAQESPRRRQRRDRKAQRNAHQSQAFMLLHCGLKWNDWSVKFLSSIVGWSGPLSEKQQATLSGLDAEARVWMAGRRDHGR